MGAAENEQIARDLITTLWSGATDAAREHPGYWNTLHTFGILRAGFPDLSVTMECGGARVRGLLARPADQDRRAPAARLRREDQPRAARI